MRPLLLALFSLLVITTRLAPHPYNFTPVIALSFFLGAYLKDLRLAIAIPLIGMFLSDVIIGLYPSMWVVYLTLVGIVLFGWKLDRPHMVQRVSLVLTCSIIFYLTTNFAVWAMTPMYTKDLAGLLQCYWAAIPFFRNAILGDLCYATILFGSVHLAERWTVPQSQPLPC